MSTSTMRGDTIDLTASAAWSLVEFYNNLEMNAKFIGADKNKPFVLNDSGVLAQTGQYLNRPKWNRLTDIVKTRNLSSGAMATTRKLTTRNDSGVRVSKKIENIVVSDTIFNQDGITQEQVERQIGDIIGKEVAMNFRKLCIGIAMAILNAMTNTEHTYSNYAASVTRANLTVAALANALYKMGDRADFLRMMGGWIMHSKARNDLFQNQVGSSVAGIADAAQRSGDILTMGWPYATADEDSLIVTNGGSWKKNYTLGVGPGLIDIEFQGLKMYPGTLYIDRDNPEWHFTGSIELIIYVNGFKYATASGSNPSDDVLLTAGSWTAQYANHKEIPLVGVEGNNSID